MAENWVNYRITDLFPTDATQAVGQATSAMGQYISVVKTALQVQKTATSALASGGSAVDLLSIAVQAVQDLVQGLLQALRVHVLFVPIPKITPNTNPSRDVPASLTDLAYSLGYDAEQAGLVFSSSANNAYTALSQTHDGGNAAFFNTVVRSFYDELDLNRPQYTSPSDAVACVAMLAGSPSMSDLIRLGTAFNKLFHPEHSLVARVVPVPQNVRVKPITAPHASRTAVRVEWDSPKASYDSPYFPGVTQRVKKYAVIRSTATRAAHARSILDFFTTRDITEGLTSTDGAAKVVATGSTFNGSFVDTDVLDVKLPYYYCVAWQVGITEGSAAEVVLPWDLVSSVQKVSPKRAPVANHGVPPDWVARGSILDLFPDAAAIVRGLVAKVTAAGDLAQRPGSGSQISIALDVMTRNLDALLTRVNALNDEVARINGAILADAPNIYMTEFHGLGGNAFLLSELATRLNNQSDVSRPPFDHNEYVMGLLFVVGGPRLADITPAIAVFQALFTAPKSDDPVFKALDAIDGLVTEAEAQVFGPDAMSPATADADAVTGFPPTVPAGRAVADDGTVVAATDPTNAEAGFTNQPDPNIDPC